MRHPGLAITATALVALAAPSFAQKHDHQAAEGQELGQLSFPTSCAPAVQEGFERAVAMLHSFWYQEAEDAFREVAGQDPECAMAYWGVAMSRFRQLWDNPGPEDVGVARAALKKARVVESVTEREQAYVAALERFFRDAGETDHLERVRAYEGAMRKLRERDPEDTEAAIFHALSLLAVAYASPPDPTFARQKKTLAILKPILEAQPNHPGVAHYMIHASDYPPLAERGLKAARRYAEIAPDAPHALHMPSHIFTRLGLWGESIATNRAASAAARRAGWIGEELHATDYMLYAYLQRGQDREAARIVEGLPARTAELNAEDSNYWAGLYATAAMPARYALERRSWLEAAELKVPREVLPGGVWCWADGPLHLARGLGAVHTGDLEGARESIRASEVCRERLLTTRDRTDADAEEVTVNVSLWANRLDVQRRAVAAWLAFAEGRSGKAVRLMRSAADLEDAGDKPPVTPGSVAPARELLGEMLLELDRPDQALAEFERKLEGSPNRFRSLLGAARGARLAGDDEKARVYYRQLVEVTVEESDRREELEEAAKRGPRPPLLPALAPCPGLTEGLRSGLDRAELFERVWSEPVSKLAEKWGLSGRGLAKACRRLKVPVSPPLSRRSFAI